MQFDVFNQIAADITRLVVLRGSLGLIRFDIEVTPEGAAAPEPLSFALYRPGNYTQVWCQGPRAGKGDNGEDFNHSNREDRIRGGWYRLCDHDSCWRDNWSYAVQGVHFRTPTRLTGVTTWAAPVTEDWANFQHDWQQTLHGASATRHLVQAETREEMWAALVKVVCAHWTHAGHDLGDFTLEFRPRRSTNPRATRQLTWQARDLAFTGRTVDGERRTHKKSMEPAEAITTYIAKTWQRHGYISGWMSPLVTNRPGPGWNF